MPLATNCIIIGDADTDLIEMNLYDAYRKEDNARYTNEYLLRCRENKLRSKVREARSKIHNLQKSNRRRELETKEEITWTRMPSDKV